MKTPATYKKNCNVELLLKILNERMQNTIKLMPQDCTNIYSIAYFRGCQAAYKDAIEEIQTCFIETQKTAKEKQV